MAEVSSVFVYDVLVFDATVRRIDDHPHKTTAAAANRDRAAFGSILNTRFRRWAQVMPKALAALAGQALAA